MACSVDAPSPHPGIPSVYQAVLGDRFTELDPQLQRYFGPLPPGMVGRGRGVYEIAGSRRRVLRPLLAWMAWRRILFPEFGRDVPFTVLNAADASGRLSATRRFMFAHRERCMQDTMALIDGRLVDRLGRRRGLEVALTVSVHEGGLRMRSGQYWVRLGRLRVPLPPVATMTLDERVDAVDPGRQRVDVRIVAPILGEVFRYAGSFRYEVVPA